MSALPLAAQAGRPPNILFIMLDDLGYADVGAYGQEKIRTPNIDRLAAEGVRFTNCYSGGAVCAPSRACLMTGLHTGHAPVRANAGTVPIEDEDFTVAEMLKEHGYATGGYGKWGLGDAGSTGVPHRQGFDEFFGYLHQIHAHSYYPDFLWRNSEKAPLEKGKYSADVIFERSLQFLRNQRRDRPFFLYATYTLPHGRHEIPSAEPYEQQDWPQIEKNYAAMVTRADQYVGELVKALHPQGLDESTVVFFTSDNGGTGGGADATGHRLDFFRSNGNLRGQKGQLYEGGIRVPMIVRWKGRVQPGTTNELPWAFSDVMPTFAELAGIRAPKSDGISVLPSILGRKQAPDRFLYWETPGFDRSANRIRPGLPPQAVRWGDWKAVRLKPGSALELYNLREDLSERNDVASEYPQAVRRIEEYLKTARTEPRPHNTGSFEFVR